jgi:hypothetical protein
MQIDLLCRESRIGVGLAICSRALSFNTSSRQVQRSSYRRSLLQRLPINRDHKMCNGLEASASQQHNVGMSDDPLLRRVRSGLIQTEAQYQTAGPFFHG